MTSQESIKVTHLAAHARYKLDPGIYNQSSTATWQTSLWQAGNLLSLKSQINEKAN